MALYRNLIGGEYARADEAQVRAATTVKTCYVAP